MKYINISTFYFIIITTVYYYYYVCKITYVKIIIFNTFATSVFEML